MRSGNVVRVDRVDNWQISHVDDTITGLTIEQARERKGAYRLIVGATALEQIEAITTVRTK